MRSVDLDPNGRVRLSHRQLLPLNAEDAWAEMRDSARFACMDHFHRAVHFDAGALQQGITFRLEHGVAGFHFFRFGRIVRWREQVGWAFSDLARNPRRGFPHVFDAKLTPVNEESCRLDLTIRGKWTSRRLPRPLVRLWLWWSLVKMGTSFDNALLRAALHRARR